MDEDDFNVGDRVVVTMVRHRPDSQLIGKTGTLTSTTEATSFDFVVEFDEPTPDKIGATVVFKDEIRRI